MTQWLQVLVFSPDSKILAICGAAQNPAGGADSGEGKSVKTSGVLAFFPLN